MVMVCETGKKTSTPLVVTHRVSKKVPLDIVRIFAKY